LDFPARRAQATHPPALDDQALDRAIGLDHRPLGPRRSDEAGGGEVGVCVAGLGLVADRRRIVERQHRMTRQRLFLGDQKGVGADAGLHGDIAA
jgi:hypothetical protein